MGRFDPNQPGDLITESQETRKDPTLSGVPFPAENRSVGSSILPLATICNVPTYKHLQDIFWGSPTQPSLSFRYELLHVSHALRRPWQHPSEQRQTRAHLVARREGEDGWSGSCLRHKPGGLATLREDDDGSHVKFVGGHGDSVGHGFGHTSGLLTLRIGVLSMPSSPW